MSAKGKDKAKERRASVGAADANLEVPPDLVMENVCEKLKLLNYERSFCQRKRPHWKPLHHLYFAEAQTTNPTEQFHYFANLVAWLLELCGRNFNPPTQSDDPNTVCTNLVVEMKGLGLSNAVNFPPTKLKQGHGDAVCRVLQSLVEQALGAKGFAFQKPVYAADKYSEEAQDDDGGDLIGDIQDENIAGYGQDDEDEYLVGKAAAREEEMIDDNAMIESTINPEEWKLELERVAPQLRTMVIADSKDWRSHLDRAKHSLDTIKKVLPESKNNLERIQQDISTTLERLETREDYVNSHFDLQVREYRGFREQLSQMQNQYHKSTETVAELANELSRISEELEGVKQTKEERENNISDTSPLIKIKNAIQTVQSELTELSVRIGVVEHDLMKTLHKASIEKKLGKR
ncbi:intraflagellar transport protein [Chloropicon primus]|uniref:Intraflagellar transport protein n=1 Tax=Chloropicon primus TaxID=1764295 RepID=A0A5B8MF35_9CHLO|nr:intraflagellar transport protein [Chloropicon primus]UPQ98305.1 intraflagellar transport protein [Chloropicon primus]|eukprot:QDZ19096.1 intraflagellar transport protein [Chloropicon primus]